MKREKLFGEGRPKPMSRHAKVGLMRQARALVRRTEPGKHYGAITAKHLDVFRTLLWEFHNVATGLCFPSYEAIAEKADCARSTVHLAIAALEEAGLLTWVHRIKRVYERVQNLFGEGAHGQRSRVERTSNGYRFPDPPEGPSPPVESSKSETKPGTAGQDLFPLTAAPIASFSPENRMLETALARLEMLRRTAASRG